MKYIEENSEVLYLDSESPIFSKDEIENLKELALKNERERIRVCFHKNKEAKLHEMLIVMGKKNYIQPHKHESKGESYKVVEGSAVLFLFSETGEIKNYTYLDGSDPSKSFYVRIPVGVYHSLVFLSEIFVYIEATEGPFDKNNSTFAPFAPTENDVPASKEYIKSLLAQV